MSAFALDLNAYCKKAGENLDKVARSAIIDIGAIIVERTPVGDASLWKSPPPKGYVGGRAKANWQHGMNVPPSGELPDIDPTGDTSNKNIEAHVMQAAAAGIHYLTNNLPYAQSLEDGHSTQSPSGMVGLAISEWRDIVKSNAEKVK
jgi:hypothetical protein